MSLLQGRFLLGLSMDGSHLSHLLYSWMIVKLIQMHTLVPSLRSSLFQVSKYFLDYLSHRSDPISTDCYNIWVGTGGLCCQWLLLSSPRPSKRMHDLYKWIRISVIVFVWWLPAAVSASLFIVLFLLCNFWKRNKRKCHLWKHDNHLEVFFIGLSWGLQCM